MATGQMSVVIQHLRRAMLLQDGPGLTDGHMLEDYISRRAGMTVAALVQRHGPMAWSVCRRVLSNYHDGHDKSKNPVNHQKGRDGSMKRTILIAIALLALVGSTVGLSAAESETFTGTAAASGTFKRPLLIVDDQRYELKASDKADASVAELLAKFSKGDTGTYAANGRRGTVNGKDGIIIDSITPAAKPMPGTGVSTELDRHRYRSYEYTEAGGTFRLTLPEGLAVVRGILVVGPYAGADSREFYREVWYREFMHLHDFAFLGTHGVSLQNYKMMENAQKQFAGCPALTNRL